MALQTLLLKPAGQFLSGLAARLFQPRDRCARGDAHLFQQGQGHVAIPDVAAKLHQFMETPPQFFYGSRVEQLAKSLEGLCDAADRNAQGVNGFRILGMFRGTP